MPFIASATLSKSLKVRVLLLAAGNNQKHPVSTNMELVQPR